MHLVPTDRWQHSHTFGTDRPAAGERRSRLVVGLTTAFMLVEVVSGMALGSMALQADGWHMGTHAAAIGITVYAYAFARRHAGDARFSFGTGKVSALGGFGSGVALAAVALLVFGVSAARFVAPVAIRFDEAIGVALVGLGVNLASAVLLRGGGEHDHATDPDPLHHDHNLRAAYLHVLADALTSVLAIVALTAGKFLGWNWMDPLMGLVGALIIARWSFGLLRDTGRVLLDAEVDERGRLAIQRLLEADDDTRVADLHVWRVGPRHLAAIVSLVSHHPREPDHYKALLRERSDLSHVTVEVHRCPGEACGA